MKYIRQFLLITGIAFIGEILRYFIPLPIPASIYGLLLMLAGLMSGIIKLEMVKETSAFLIEIMPLMFIPSAVGLVDSWDSLGSIFIQVFVIAIVSTVLVIGIGGRVTQFIIRREEKKTDERISE